MRDSMNAARWLRIAVLLEVALIPAGALLGLWADRLLPAAGLELEEEQVVGFLMDPDFGLGGLLFLVVFGVAACGCWIASLVGLLLLRRWGAWLYLAATFLVLPAYFLVGLDVRHPVHMMLDDLVRFIPGFVLGLAFFSDAIPKDEQG